ncbi:hypothetical protein DV711_11475 [Motiliproteus coralliicola]|uniref:Uncharacterized protein n=2 Tax=Motiliproteus coralliicola TaxID=2283196 RepID=A0A369WFR0_9GAMM|nr:hypothetical protein DV711_11475 [Motiliproteus coralliicola]
MMMALLGLAGCQANAVQPSAEPAAAVASQPAAAAELAQRVNDANAERFESVEQRIVLMQEKLIELNQRIERLSVQGGQQLAGLQRLQQLQTQQVQRQMEQNSGPSTLDQLTELVFRLEQMSAESSQQSVSASATTDQAPYQLVSVYSSKGWILLKLDRLSGTTWKADGADWLEIQEVGVLPASEYQVVMQPNPNDIKGFVAARIDRNNGISWWLKDNQWEPF